MILREWCVRSTCVCSEMWHLTLKLFISTIWDPTVSITSLRWERIRVPSHKNPTELNETMLLLVFYYHYVNTMRSLYLWHINECLHVCVLLMTVETILINEHTLVCMFCVFTFRTVCLCAAAPGGLWFCERGLHTQMCLCLLAAELLEHTHTHTHMRTHTQYSGRVVSSGPGAKSSCDRVRWDFCVLVGRRVHVGGLASYPVPSMLCDWSEVHRFMYAEEDKKLLLTPQ